MEGIRGLLAGLIDYAGLFPPAAHSMADAVQRYAQHRESPDAWMLGRFVVPVARFAELEAHAAPFWMAERSWQLSAIATPAELDAVRAFNARHYGRAVIDSLEARAGTIAAIHALADGVQALGPVTLFVEVPLDGDTRSLLLAVKRRGATAKVRTGGVTADAFPSAATLATFLLDCASLDVPFKATAGLHHAMRGEYPLTYDDNSARATMFGFLGLFLAALMARQGATAAVLEALLEERDPGAIVTDDAGISWRGHRVGVAEICAGRSHAALSFGSCSFDEPVHELVAMGLG